MLEIDDIQHILLTRAPALTGRYEFLSFRDPTTRRCKRVPDRHPDRMIAASIVLYVGLGVIIAITVWNHWKTARP